MGSLKTSALGLSQRESGVAGGLVEFLDQSGAGQQLER